MRSFGYALGYVLVVAAAATGFAQLLMIWAAGRYLPVSIGSIWFNLHANSLVGFQAFVESHLGSLAWAPVRFLIAQPAFLVLLVPGLLLLVACRPRQRGLG
ncbi:hypothetical protein HRbin40_02662 [bacterium HR40]|nr:hypothetical protein HRbin40_02662 [bacterium HR40]